MVERVGSGGSGVRAALYANLATYLNQAVGTTRWLTSAHTNYCNVSTVSYCVTLLHARC